MTEHDPIDPADLRVSHAEREHVVGLLQEAMTRGMLDSSEFDERSTLALEARTRRDLNVLVSDIALPGVETVVATPVTAGDTVRLGGWLASVKRDGGWPVPRKLVLSPRMGSIQLDFTETRIDHAVIEIEVDVAGGSIELRLPEGASAATDNVYIALGSVEDHRRNVVANGRPHFVITGQVRWGSIELRGPRRRLFGGW
jgi:hypothetical protein